MHTSDRVHHRNLRLAISLLLTFYGLASALRAEEGHTIDFDRDIRPLLSDNCFQCHGPDGEQREADLRLDLASSALADRHGSQIIVPGHPRQSELYRRISASDPDERMPPPSSQHQLTDQQIALIRDWIKQGAEWAEHWAFVPPVRPVLPTVTRAEWPANAIDHFVLAELEAHQLEPSAPARDTTLLRRVAQDLTGLPPTLKEIDTYLNDRRPDAYAHLVERLLASPHFGERMAIFWLDAARYADTSGYQNDGPRYMWRWRDWVIEALNHNLPFDQFTIEQIAGDMLPSPTLKQRIATGFNRNHRGNAEGGIIPEEYAVEYVADRVDTTATVWLGLTMGCARCHDHKFDPISQQEYYQFFSFFNNVPEFGRAIKEGNSPPWLKAPTPQQQKRLVEIDQQLDQSESQRPLLEKATSAAQLKWEAASLPADSQWTISRGLVTRIQLDRDAKTPALENVGSQSRFKTGIVGQAAELDGRGHLAVADVGNFGYFDKFSFALWMRPLDESASVNAQTIISRVANTDRSSGYAVTWKDGHLHVNLVKRWLDDAIRVRTKERYAPDRWYHITVSYDGTRTADGISIYVDGHRKSLNVDLDLLNQSFASAEPFRIGGGGGPDSQFVGWVDDVHIYDRVLRADEVLILANRKTVPEILSESPESRSTSAAKKLTAYFVDRHAPEPLRISWNELIERREERAVYWESLPTVMVMEEVVPARSTHVLRRGQYDQPGELVTPNVPEFLRRLSEDRITDRLQLANWLVSDSNPLTARVAVNRFWQVFFGTGLVETPEDFGSQGSRPTHPALLDWLAVEFVQSDWDVKGLARKIVLSQTYRQSSHVTADQLVRDPTNRLLARGPRFRLGAEAIRDQALAASGLLSDTIGGPSVLPYQPPGLWKEIASVTEYPQSHGRDLYRRSLYTYWKRTVAPPTLTTLDASARETCIVRRPRTNTPLQALALMNDVTFVESGRVLAQRVMRESGPNPKDRLTRAFRLVTSRRPTREELTLLVAGFREHHRTYQQDREAAKVLLGLGEYPMDETLDSAELAAYTVVANMILNLDESVTKE